MSTRIATIGAWGVAGVALLAWGAVVFFAWTIQQDADARAFSLQETYESGNKTAVAIRLHSLMQDTAAARAELKGVFTTDVVSVVDMIEQAGKSAGVAASLGSALPENAAPSKIAGGPELRAIGFVVNAQGSFQALMRAVTLFETLPIPSSISRLDIERINPGTSNASDAWHMSVYIRVLSISRDVSS